MIDIPLVPATYQTLPLPVVRLLVARLSSTVAWCVGGKSAGSSYLLRARFLVFGAAAISVAALGIAALYAASPNTTWGIVGWVLALAIPGPLIPLLIRRGVGLPVLGCGFILVLQTVLVVSAFLDRGINDVALLWLIVTPLFSAFVGGRRAGWLTASTAGLAGIALLVATERGYSFPDLMDPVFAQRYYVANFVAAALFVAGLAWLYEGPFMRQLRALTRQLRKANATLRRELAARRRAQAAAEVANQAKDALLANMSHEFRTPLTAILSGVDILMEEASEDDRRVLESVQRGGERLLQTLDGVLDLAWHESARATLSATSLDLIEAVTEAVAPYKNAAEAKGLGLHVRGTHAWTYADSRAFQRTVAAVVENAVRFTEVGQITVSVSATETRASVEIADTGVGMSAAFLPYATESFRQASEGDARTHEGAGIGLTLAQKLVEQMGGGLTIQSVEGEGTTVRIELPVAQASGDGAVAERGLPALTEEQTAAYRTTVSRRVRTSAPATSLTTYTPVASPSVASPTV